MCIEGFLFAAQKEAMKSNCQYRLGAIAVSKGKIVSKGFNRYCGCGQYHSRKGMPTTIHAEQITLRRTGNERVDTVYVVRLDANGNFTMSKPCQRCTNHARKSGVRFVFFTNWNGDVEKLTL